MAKTTLNTALIKQAVLAKQANRRQATSATKTRGLVAGGGKKPWKQKGTGRARAGSNRSPLWRSGGITFGPSSNRQYKQQLPKKMAKAAFIELLKHLHQINKVVNGGSISLKAPKTKEAIALLAKHTLTNKSVIFITEKIQPELVLACQNLPGISVITQDQLSINDLASQKTIVMDNAVFERYFPSTKAAKSAIKKEKS